MDRETILVVVLVALAVLLLARQALRAMRGQGGGCGCSGCGSQDSCPSKRCPPGQSDKGEPSDADDAAR
jgi:hypothetical protein